MIWVRLAGVITEIKHTKQYNRTGPILTATKGHESVHTQTSLVKNAVTS